MTGYHTIGEFSRLTGLTEKALRLYDAKGLLTPAEVDLSTGYRWYAPDQVGDGRMIALLRAVDMPLADVAEVMGRPAVDRSAAVADYWYRVERALDDRREAVRTAREAGQRAAIGNSHAAAATSAGRSDGVFATVTTLAGTTDPREAGPAYVSAMRTAYWDDADLPAAIAIGVAGIGRLLTEADRAGGDTATELRSIVKGLLYDVASFTWPGWAAAGIDVSPGEARLGLAAARANLAMAEELGKGELARSRAHWMLGAHLLASGPPDAAANEFETARSLAAAAGARPEALLAEAFRSLAGVAAGEPGAERNLEDVIATLETTEDGGMFIDQVVTARTALGITTADR